MVTEAQILSIDYQNITCIIEIPLFESAGNNEKCILNAVFALSPGLGNNYIINDIVWVGFENDILNKPVVIGKITLDNVTTSSIDTAIKTNNWYATGSVSLPGNTIIQSTTGNYSFNELINKKIKTQANQTSYCIDACTNIDGYTQYGFSCKLESECGYYAIYYNNSATLTRDLVYSYMTYMTGISYLPTINNNTPNMIFNTIDGRTYYPVYKESSQELFLVILNDETLDDHIRRIRDEYGNEVNLSDLARSTPIELDFRGATVNFAEGSGDDPISSNFVDKVDLT